MTANTDLFVRVLAQIERQPERWAQRHWASRTDCGTAYCMAGWACQLSGVEAVFLSSDGTSEHTARSTGPVGVMSLDAQDLLGGRYADGRDLFDANNTLADLYQISADILGIDVQVLRDKVAAEVADGAVQS